MDALSSSSDGLVDRTARSAAWRFAAAVVAAGSQLVVGVLLARLLPPAEFGLMALAVVVLGVVQPLGDLGIGNAVVQRAQLTDRHIRSASTFAMAIGVLIASMAALAAPLAGVVTGESHITPIVRLLALAFAFRGIGVVSEALLRRHLDFRRLFFIDTCSYGLGYGIVAVILAMRGYGVWSLAWGAVSQALLASAAQMAAARPDVRPLLAWRELRDLLRFGIGSAAGGWINYFALNGDNFVVGRLMGATSLGLYGRAYALMNLPHTYVSGVMSGVLFPAFAQVQANPDRLRRGYLLMTRLTATIAAPALTTLAIGAPYIVAALYGPRWMGVVVPLQVLCVAGYFRALYHLGGVVIQSAGRVYGEVARQSAYAALVIGGVAAASRYGLPWVASAVGLAILFMYVATGSAALRAAQSGWREYLRVQTHAVVITTVTATSAIAARAGLESQHASTALIACGVVSAAALPWSLGVLWELGDPALAPLLPYLPRWCVQRAAALRSRRLLAIS